MNSNFRQKYPVYRISLWLFLCGFAFNVNAQTNQWSIAGISDSLKKEAKSIVRYEKTTIDLGSVGKAVITYSKVVTILSEEAEDELFFAEYEDNFRKLKEADIYVYNEKGEKIDHFKKKQLEKVLGSDGVSFISNYKVYSFRVPAAQYPITVQFEYEVSLKGYIDFEDFLVARPEQSIQEASYTILTDIENPIRYKSYFSNIKPVINNKGSKQEYIWSVSNVNAIKYEKNASRNGYIPKVLITPTKFEMDDYPGNFSDWREFGKWYHSMCANTFDLSSSQADEIKAEISKCNNNKEKIETLYQYMQKNCRYVGIQLGIGGFKPFKSSFVHKNKYGDCKALSNYMQAILSAVGIESYQALINAGKRQTSVDPTFANNQFNHVILCVPNNGDTVWLECTSRDNQTGVLGSFTENRNALLIKPDGGYLVATPLSKANHNTQNVKTNIYVKDDFSAEVEMNMHFTGELLEMYNYYVNDSEEQDRKNFLLKSVGLKPFEDLAVSNNSNNKNNINLKLDYSKIQDFNAGSKYFLRQHLFDIWQTIIPADVNRSSDYYFNFPFIENDTTVYFLPANLTIDNMPKSIDISSKYASYKTEAVYNKEANTISVITRLVLLADRIPAKNFLETKIFFDKVITDSSQKIVVKK